MSNLRLGDVIDDYCIKCRRLTNHAIVSIVNDEAAKVRCRSCYHDHNYQHEQIPPSKRDLKKMELFNAVLSKVDPASGTLPDGEPAPMAPDEIEITEEVVEEAVEAVEAVSAGESERAAEPVAPKKARGRKKAQ
jgi:hypothetical protein